MKIRFFDINWDTDSKSEDIVDDVDLPTDVIMDIDADVDVQEDGADILSDKYGFCVNSFNYESI